MSRAAGTYRFTTSPIYDQPGRVGGVFTIISQERLNTDDGYMADRNALKASPAQKDVLQAKEREGKILLKKRNERLKQSEERYISMIDEVEDYAIISLDLDGTILNWNKGVQKKKGLLGGGDSRQEFLYFLPGRRSASTIASKAYSNGDA